ncbi:hypothetical protein ACH5RR_038927 [Cinchona calisaya]|uniref:Uncharacterized protein n=1 Tax=Cinchona calisaya TaxID=153742 RepID=A0ABD2Y2A2_9GENT
MVLGYGEAYAPQGMYSMMCDEQSHGKMMVFQVYGGIPCGYTSGGGWQVEKESGETIQGIDLSSGFWAEEGEDHEAVSNEESEEETEASDGAENEDSEEDEEEDNGSEIVQGACIFGFSTFFKQLET